MLGVAVVLTAAVATSVIPSFAADSTAKASETTSTTAGTAQRTLSDPTSYPLKPLSSPDDIAESSDVLEVQEKRVAEVSRTVLTGPLRGIAVANLSVGPGRYRVSYSFDALIVSDDPTITLTCGLVDANGVERFLIPDPVALTARSGWQRHLVTSPFSLPDLTVGIRCRSDDIGVVHAVFRDVAISVTRRPEE
ncbi:MAG: hypothetical protein RI885_693 [Actinomycetota bacterium]|jgi:hypothetical protein